MDLDEFEAYVNEVLEYEIPPELLVGLNLGVIVLPQLEQSRDESGFIIMGLYVKNNLGKQIILYYGSFEYFYNNKSKDKWKQKILATIKHELTHHVEALAGQEDLAKKEMYQKYMRKNKK